MAPNSTGGLLIDGSIVFLYFAVIIAIGLYKGRGSKDLESFAVGNRNIPWWAVLASILAAEISAATFLGAPGEGYEKRNFTYAQLALGTILARVVIAYIFIKPYYDFRVVSIYEYLLLRFGTRTKDTASAIFLITRALASGTRLYVAAIVFVMGYEMVTGETLNIWQQVWIYIVALSFITALTAVYTALGRHQGSGLDRRHPGLHHVRLAWIRHLVAPPCDSRRLAGRYANAQPTRTIGSSSQAAWTPAEALATTCAASWKANTRSGPH